MVAYDKDGVIVIDGLFFDEEAKMPVLLVVNDIGHFIDQTANPIVCRKQIKKEPVNILFYLKECRIFSGKTKNQRNKVIISKIGLYDVFYKPTIFIEKPEDVLFDKFGNKVFFVKLS